MPELPDITVYIEALERRIEGAVLEGIRIKSPFLLRSVAPALADLAGRKVVGLRRLGKRIAIGLEGDDWLVLHLMIAGRLHWKDEKGAAIPGGRNGVAAFDFSTGTLVLTEAGAKKRASLYAVHGSEALAEHNPGGLELSSATAEAFAAALTAENHTLKRALTDPHLFSGIGNAYSDEILHRAGLSPIAMTGKLSKEEAERLFDVTREVLGDWCDRLRAEAGEGFPEKVTAFRPDMSVHGKYGKPCPVCGTAIQRIRYADNEANYCPRCQTNGALLADRSMSRLLKGDWPKSIEELEKRRSKA